MISHFFSISIIPYRCSTLSQSQQLKLSESITTYEALMDNIEYATSVLLVLLQTLSCFLLYKELRTQSCTDRRPSIDIPTHHHNFFLRHNLATVVLPSKINIASKGINYFIDETSSTDARFDTSSLRSKMILSLGDHSLRQP